MQKDEQPEGEQLLIEILQDLSLCLGEAAQQVRIILDENVWMTKL